MKRALELEGSPALSVPLRFLLTAPWFAIAAGTLLAWYGEDALVSRWSPVTVALTHLLTLGFLAMAMAGALLQMLPVVAGFGVPSGALVARVAWPALVAGTLLLAGALLSGTQALLPVAAIALALALLTLLAALALAMAHKAPGGAEAMVRGMRLALASLAVTVTLGLLLAAFLGGQVVVPALELTDIHAAWGLLGWVMMLVLAVAYQVIPMFQATAAYPARFTLALPPLLAGTLLVWSVARFAGAEWTWLAQLGVALCVAAFAGMTLVLLARRRRPVADATTFYWRLSMGSLAACALAAVLPETLLAQRSLLLGTLFIGGFAMGAVNGMLYKIVPFLLWYHLQQRGVPKAKLPGAQHWIADRSARGQFWLHLCAVALLCGAVFLPQVFARAAGAVLCVAAGKLAYDLGEAALRYRRISRESALEGA